MDLYEVIDHVAVLLQKRGRLAYRALKVQFQLDEEQLAALKEELIDGQRVAVDEDGKVLVWKGTAEAQETGKRAIVESEPRRTSSDADSGTDKPRDPKLDVAERRQLTVMFCDLVGSTALSTQLDPEDLREVIQAYREACAAGIRRFEGHLAKYIGDGLLVYFGYPVAHEDDAPRAVRTALGIIAAIQQLSFPTIQLPRPLQVRIGIHTGLVVAGEMGTEDQPEPLAIVGETPNIAARLQEKALPNGVVMSPTTQQLVAGLFESQDLGPQRLKGLSTPLTVYQVVRESEARSRFEAAVKIGLTPLVGRSHELGLLRDRWEQAKGGEGQVLLLSGEAGIGKSRLMQTLKEQVVAEGAMRMEFSSSPYHQHSAFYPVIEHLQRLLQFAPHETPEAKLTRLQRALVAYRFPQADTLALLAALLSLPHPEGAPPLTLSPQKQKQKTQEALVAWLMEEAERQAVYLVWEDLHWADPSSLEVLTLLINQVPALRVLALLTFRPEFVSPWSSRSHLTQLTLNRLGRPHVEAMIEEVTRGKALPSEVRQQIVAKTDGVPLFVEELTKMVLESSLLTEAEGHYQLLSPLPPLAIPSTLQDSLMARLDRLSTVREIVQLGATLGREFSYELLHAVSPLDEATLQHGLRQLVEVELMYQRGAAPRVTYFFKHALIQDAAYQSLLKSKRQQLHQQIAQILEERFPDTQETQSELLAHHYTEAGLIVQAIPYWQKAGVRAIQRSANEESVAHLTKGLELLKILPDTPERMQQELALQITLGAPLTATKGYAAREVGQVYTRARELCRQLGETPQLIPVLFGLWRFYLQRGELQTVRELGEQCLSLAQQVQDPARLLRAYNTLGMTLFFLGELTAAREHLELGIALYEPQQRRSLAFVQDPMVVCLSYVAWTLWHLGYPDQALRRSQEALALARELSHPYSLATALFFAAELHYLRREVQAVQESAEAVITLSAEQGFPFWLAQGTCLRGWALVQHGQQEEGSAQMRQGLAIYEATGAELGRTYWLALPAGTYGKGGQVEKGLSLLTEALMTVHQSGERYYEADLYRLAGELSLRIREPESGRIGDAKNEVENRKAGFSFAASPFHRFSVSSSEDCFHKAIEVARKQQAKSLELRATMSLAHLWQQQDKQHEARTMLADIYNWFTEGFDTKDLQEAKVLLDALS